MVIVGAELLFPRGHSHIASERGSRERTGLCVFEQLSPGVPAASASRPALSLAWNVWMTECYFEPDVPDVAGPRNALNSVSSKTPFLSA
jgi:hypothetical protein